MNNNERLEFLRQVAGAGAEANMWAIGEKMDMDRSATEALAMELMATEELEFVNLSGGVALTESGRQCLGEEAGCGHSEDLAGLVKDLEATQLKLEAPGAADFQVDLATLKAQMNRSQPLNQVIKACLGAMTQALEKAGGPAKDLAQRIENLSL